MDFIFLSKTPLFRGTTPDEVQNMLSCLNAHQKQFSKDDAIYTEGESVQALGLVLSGSVNIENIALCGNTSLLSHISAGQIFAEAYACTLSEPLMVNVISAEPSTVLFLNISQLLQTCPNACPHHAKIICNLLCVMAQKNLNLSRRILHTSSKSIRGRLISYLSFQAAKQGSYNITIPFNRQQLADYLSVERSALSNELSKMQRDGLLTVNKNQFKLTL